MIPYKATVLCVSLLTSIMLVAPSALAAYVSIDGSVPIGVSAPMFPVNAQQCQEFSKSAAEQREVLVQWHDQCLEANRKGPTARKGAQCTAPACEAYHIGRDRFSKLASEEAAACFTAVTAKRAELYKSLGTEENPPPRQNSCRLHRST
jgi:hypothetical protein